MQNQNPMPPSISTLAKAFSKGRVSTPTEKLKRILPLEQVKGLFARFGSIYGHLWTSRHASASAWQLTMEEWQRCLGIFTWQQLQQATDRCADGEFGEMPPMLPKFKKICLLGDNPSSDKAFELAVKKDFSNPVIKLAHGKINSWDWSHQTDTELRKRWENVYVDALKEYNELMNNPMLENQKQ